MRYRERNVSSDDSWGYSISHTNNSHVSAGFSGSGSVTTVAYDKMWDVEIPDFHRRSRNGEVFFNPMHRIEYEATTSSGTPFGLTDLLDPCLATYSNMDRVRRCLGIQGDTETLLYDLPKLIKVAQTKAWADVNSSKFQGLVFLGELRETIGMIRRPLRNMTRYAEDQYKGVPRGKRLVDLFASNWLAFRYGWRPLVKDLGNAVEAVDLLRQNSKRIRHTATGYVDVSNSRDVTTFAGGGPCLGIFNTVSEYTMDQSAACRVRILYEIDNRALFGLSFQELPIALWELIPYSFVADWVVNIGDYIQAITPKVGVKVLGGTTTVKQNHTSVGTTEITHTSGTQWSLAYTGSYPTEISRRVKFRSPTAGSPALTTTSVIDDFDLGTARVTDALALLWGVLTRRKP